MQTDGGRGQEAGSWVSYTLFWDSSRTYRSVLLHNPERFSFITKYAYTRASNVQSTLIVFMLHDVCIFCRCKTTLVKLAFLTPRPSASSHPLPFPPPPSWYQFSRVI